MANFRCVNYCEDTIWLDIDKVLFIYQPGDNDDPTKTVVKLVTGETMILSENYEELLEDWGINLPVECA